MNKTSLRIATPLLALMVSLGTLTAVAQSKSSSAKSGATVSQKESSKYHRLPTHFGKLELKEEQVQEIYGIKEMMGPRIDELAKQLAELKEEQKDKIKDVLTRTQVTALNKLKAGAEDKPVAAKKSTSRKKASTKPVKE